jgi:hypothetical protein
MSKTADRPHSITIMISLLAAAISATGVYLGYKNSMNSRSGEPKTVASGYSQLPPRSVPLGENAASMDQKVINGPPEGHSQPPTRSVPSEENAVPVDKKTVYGPADGVWGSSRRSTQCAGSPKY